MQIKKKKNSLYAVDVEYINLKHILTEVEVRGKFTSLVAVCLRLTTYIGYNCYIIVNTPQISEIHLLVDTIGPQSIKFIRINCAISVFYPLFLVYMYI